MSLYNCFRRRVFCCDEERIGWLLGAFFDEHLCPVIPCKCDDESMCEGCRERWRGLELLELLVEEADDEGTLTFLMREIPECMASIPDHAYADFMEGFFDGYILARYAD